MQRRDLTIPSSAVLRRREVWAAILGGTAVVVIAGAGLLKLSDLPSFQASLTRWRSVPPSVSAALGVVVPVLEVALAGCWWVGKRKRRVEIFFLALLLVFTAAWVYEWLAYGAPHCACLGVLSARLAFLDEAKGVILRNTTLASLLTGAVILRGHQQRMRIMSVPATSARAFTLLETILVISILLLLVALLSPRFPGVRRSARVAKTLANLQQHMNIVSIYASEYRDQYPCLTDPRATFSVVRCESAGVAVRARYFAGADAWYIGLADGYYNGQWRSPAFRSPLEPPDILGGSYVLSCSTIAAPEYYMPEGRMDPPRQLRAVRTAEVVFPSLKGVITDGSCFRVYDGSYDRERVRFQAALADGAARAFNAAEHLGPQMHSGDGPYLRYGPHWPWFIPMTHTLEGVRGRDVR